MEHFISGTPALYQAFWWVAITASLIFLIQTTLLIIGGFDSSIDASHTDISSDFDGATMPFQMFTLRNLVNFLLGFGWSGMAFYKSISNSFLLIVIAALFGFLFVLVFFLIIRQLLRLSEDNTFNIGKLIGKTGSVYIPIPGNMEGTGQIQISSRGANHELPAMTEGDLIATGAAVIVDRMENNILIVKKITQ